MDTIDGMLPHLKLAHSFWKEHLTPGSFVIDATVGNGKDSLILANISLTPEEGKLFCFDIQQEAIKRSSLFLQKNVEREIYEKIEFHCRCHSSFLFLSHEVDMIVYNLGYLPGSDRKINSTGPTTIQSIRSAKEILKKNGAISLTCYIGHKEGKEEYQAVVKELNNFDFDEWSISKHEWISRPNSPILFWCKKKS